jgi:hypothetical protein
MGWHTGHALDLYSGGSWFVSPTISWLTRPSLDHERLLPNSAVHHPWPNLTTQHNSISHWQRRNMKPRKWRCSKDCTMKAYSEWKKKKKKIRIRSSTKPSNRATMVRSFCYDRLQSGYLDTEEPRTMCSKIFPILWHSNDRGKLYFPNFRMDPKR